MSPVKITKCRISGSENLIKVASLGDQVLTGVFPKSTDQEVTCGPLDLVWCPDSGLLQLGHNYDLGEMYGPNYGYRSGLNATMVEHLCTKVGQIVSRMELTSGDLVLDIGSNDGTLLSFYRQSGLIRVGMDPSGAKFKKYYATDIDLIPDFFSSHEFQMRFNVKAKVITSIAMFYDLEVPANFVRDVRECLAKDGIWHFEQSYMPTMLRCNAYDTICHEHLEYYSFAVVQRLLESEGLKIIDVQMNSVNGGSFAVTATHRSSTHHRVNSAVIDWLIEQEECMNLASLETYKSFEDRIQAHRRDLLSLIRSLRADGKKIVGYGASTKGNVLLQFCGFNADDISCIAEVNPDKFGSITPGTHIPIVSEAEARSISPDYMLVMPWHFRDSIIRREAEFVAKGGKLIFPLPDIEII